MSVIKNSIIYLGSSILNKSLPLLLLPILTFYLNPNEFGLVSLFQTFVTFFMAFIGMAMQTNIASQYFNSTREQINTLIGNIIFILLFNTIFCLFFLSLLYCAGVYEIFSISYPEIFYVVLICFFSMIVEFFTTILRNNGEAFFYGKIEVSTALIRAIVIVFSLVLLKQGWLSQAYGMLFSSLIMAVVSFFFLRKRNYLGFTYNFGIVKDILKVSIPLIPHVIGGAIIAMSDRLFIERMIGLEAVGIYSVGYMFGMVVMLFVDAFIKAWSPWFYKTLSSNSESKKYIIVKYIYLYIIGLFLFSVVLSVIAEFILPYVISSKYSGAGDFILWVSLGYAMQGVYKIFFPFLVYVKKTYFLAMTTIIAAVLNLIMNYYFILEFGAIGAAYATIISYFISALLVFIIQKHFFKMPWGGKV